MIRDICFIDDTIPAAEDALIDDTQRLNRSNLMYLLNKKDEWAETEVRSLVKLMTDNNETWRVSAFTHPALYLNSLIDEGYRPDIVIYDWEYAAGSDDPAEMLLKILETSYNIVFIYSGSDHKGQINEALKHQAFKEYISKRLDVLMKDEHDSQKLLLEKAASMYEESFSFRFGDDLRKATQKALENVLITFGKHHKDFVHKLVKEEDTVDSEVKGVMNEKIRNYLSEDKSLIKTLMDNGGLKEKEANDILSILCGRICSLLNAEELDLTVFRSDPKVDEESIISSKMLWSQRMYYRPSDPVVRKGDIIFDAAKKYYSFVITADCDLTRFWYKTHGYVNLIPISNYEDNINELRDRLLVTMNDNQVKKVIQNMNPKSFTGRIDEMVEGPFLMPFVNIDGKLHNFIGFPKEIFSAYVPPPEIPKGKDATVRKNMCLSYENWPNVMRIVTVSEPFLTPMVLHCISSVSGYGSPDYPSIIRKAILESTSKCIDPQLKVG